MRHRIFVETIAPLVTVTGDELHHSVRVVRLRPGEEVEIFDRAGNAARGTVETIERDHAVISAGEALPSRESPLAIHLAMAIIQLEKFELVLQKATELGVHSIIPLITDRVDLRQERYLGKSERWERIVFEAVRQSGRTRVPSIETPAKLEERLARPGVKVAFDADASDGNWRLALGAIESREIDLTLFIGPEGGWSERELQLAREYGAVFARLGPRRLRAETAAIVALAVAASSAGDL